MQNRFIDLYSDTKSKPSPGMRKAMAEAEVGDEQKYEDPTVNRLRERICEILGKEDAVFMPSGTMCNQSAIRVHCRLGDEVIADKTAHIINAETGGTAANSGVMIRMLDGPNGVFTAEQVQAAIRDPNSRNAPRSRLAPVLVPAEPLQLGPRRVQRFEKVEVVRAALAWAIPGLTDPSAPMLDLLAMVLGAGESSVLWQEIREKKKLVHSIDASSWNPGSSGLFCISFTCDAGKRAHHEARPEAIRKCCKTEMRKRRESRSQKIDATRGKPISER